MSKIHEISCRLAGCRLRFLTDVQIGVLRRQHSASRDEVRAAAVVADRIRRKQQIAERLGTFSVAGLVKPDAPVILKSERKTISRRSRRKET